VEWEPDDDPFEVGVEYKCIVTLTADNDYIFSRDIEVFINDQPATIEVPEWDYELDPDDEDDEDIDRTILVVSIDFTCVPQL
jgi:hypothetical protein